jgi:hypothetical protein
MRRGRPQLAIRMLRKGVAAENPSSAFAHPQFFCFAY